MSAVETRSSLCMPASGKFGAFVLMLIAAIIPATASHGQASPSDGAQSKYFTASPIVGRAPLTVTFCALAGIGIDFGDGTSSSMDQEQSGECSAGNTAVVRHTYTAAGSYQLTGFPCPSAHEVACRETARQASSIRISVTP